MSANNKVIWHEGMPLEPQHFQQQIRYVESLINFKARLASQVLWGFSELTLDTDLLSIGKLNIATAKGAFQDGTVFSIPNNDEVPVSYTIPEGLTNTVFYLAIPVDHVGVADAGDEESKQPYRYKAKTKRIVDAIADSDEEADITVGSLAVRILTEHDDRDGYLCLPMAKITEARANHQIKFEKAFIPAWLDLHQAEPLSSFLEETITLLSNRAEMLANRLTDTQQAGTADMVDLTLLQLSNRYENVFRNLQVSSPLLPKIFYSQLTEMLAELSTYTTDKRRPDAIPAYQHDNLYETFKPIIKSARKSLSIVLEQNATAVDLVSQGHGLYVGEISDSSIIKTCSFVLAVYADVPMETLRNSFPAQVKIAPVEQIRNLVSRSLPGVTVQAIAIAPRQIPHHPNFTYFAVDIRSELWQSLEKSQGVAVHVSGELSGLQLELWAIKG